VEDITVIGFMNPDYRWEKKCRLLNCILIRVKGHYLCIDQLLVRFGILVSIEIGTGSRFLGRFPTIELRDDLGVDPVKLFLRENTKKRPC
jgi:hypothetical protein